MMNSAKLIVKKIKKGMTILELVVAMALVSIVLAGATVALFAANKVSKTESTTYASLTNARNLSYKIDLIFKSEHETPIDVVVSDSIGKESCQNLFTVDGKTYGFDKDTFGIVVDNSISGKDVLYKSDYAMYISTKKWGEDEKFAEFTIHFDEKYVSSISLVERI